ncbi:hypothetical protein QZH56_22580 [Streptomyces olivoreticuli]|uniref:hypothetical protein n=1 Tax=Streptomyces olivoreticuli TaxID=68246 RepID=UPI00265AAA20|nr:hypothetical protein [Streptomyces olivoreticuli]WKK21630.1 hypothetical protein QZH56_22580 [Streptomyces olivoreticuli]
MKWTRAVLAVVGAAALWPAVGPAGAAVADDGRGGVHLLLNGAFDNRPGELVDIDVQGVRGRGDVTVSSPVFPHRVKLVPYAHRAPAAERGHHARPAIAMTVRPGSYPLTVRAGGHVVAEERVEVGPARRPQFTVTAPDEVMRPGERLWMAYDDLFPGETGTSFEARSPAFPEPVRLAHDPAGTDWNNPRLFSGGLDLPASVKDGTYKVTLTGPGGRTVEEKPLVIRAARPGDRDYVGRARGPAFFDTSARSGPERARTHGHTVPPGGTVNVLWRDGAPDPGEEDRLTATSPAFEHPVPLRRDESKAGDGDSPRYYGPAHIRRGLGEGRYPVTVVSHHGRVRKIGQLVVTGAEASAKASGSALVTTVVGVGLAGLATLTGVALVKSRTGRRTGAL